MAGLSSDWKQFYDDVITQFSQDQPVFLSRIGGSDTDALIDYLSLKAHDPESLSSHLRAHLHVVEKFNGFYDLKGDKLASYIRYLNELRRCYLSTKMATLVHTHFVSTFFPEAINEQFFTANVPNRATMEKFLDQIVRADGFIGAYPYSFIETAVRHKHSLFQAFSTILAGKAVLVICPFEETIHANFENRNLFFKHDYVYPDFVLKTINTPITYHGIDESSYPNANWFETVDALKRQVRDSKFDIALMACGSYAMPLGDFIERELKKKAIYVGGVLQLYFGIMGKRYENPFFLDQINREYFIQPIEREKYLSLIPTSETTIRDAFGAYF
jgi:hypothetical protein